MQAHRRLPILTARLPERMPLAMTCAHGKIIPLALGCPPKETTQAVLYCPSFNQKYAFPFVVRQRTLCAYFCRKLVMGNVQ